MKLIIFFGIIYCSLLVSTAAFFLPKPFGNQVPELSISSTDFDGSIIIIGSGAAGLYAAYTLEYLGVTNYTILEAKSDYGGRVKDMEDFIDLPLDVGAEWIHTRPRILQDLILFDNTVKDETFRYRPITWRLEIFNRLQLPFGLFAFAFYREWKFKSSTWKSYLTDYIYSHVSSDRVHLNTPVTAVDSTGDQVTVTTQNGTELVADKVIVAVPPTMLKLGNITFTPTLPDSKQSEINKVRMPRGFKLFIEFERRFYAHVTLLDMLGRRYLMDGTFRKPTDRNVMVVFGIGGHEASDMVEWSEEELVDHVMIELDKLYWGKANRFYIQHRLFNWFQEDYIEGTWVNNLRYDKGTIRTPVEDKVYFAGAYLSDDWPGTVHGAALSGRQAVMQLLQDALTEES